LNNKNVPKMYVPDKSKSVMKHKDLFDISYPNVFICSSKNTGKTNLIYYLLTQAIDKDTEVIFFVSTINNDATYSGILDWLDKNEIEHTEFSSIFAEDGRDYLKTIVNDLKDRGEKDKFEYEVYLKRKKMLSEIRRNKESLEDQLEKINTLKEQISEYEKEHKMKDVQTPKYVIIFDDISAEMKNNGVLASLIKMNRHHKVLTVISSQYPKDIKPEVRSNIDVIILLGGHNEDKLRMIHELIDTNLSFGKFWDMYLDATNNKYGFLYIDKSNGVFRRNFTEKYSI